MRYNPALFEVVAAVAVETVVEAVVALVELLELVKNDIAYDDML